MNILKIVSVCVYSLSHPACKPYAPCSIATYLVRLYSISPHYPINDKIFGKKLLYIKFFILSTTLSETFFILRKVQLDVIKNKHTLTSKHPIFLSDFN